MKGTNRTKVAAFLAAQRHLRDDLRGAKTLTQMAAELGTSKSTVRRWLRRDHWELWMEHWASVEEIWEEAQLNRRLLSSHKSQAEQVALGKQRRELMMALMMAFDTSLLEIVGGHGVL